MAQQRQNAYNLTAQLKATEGRPMKHLIPYLQDNAQAAEYLRSLRWPDGVNCPRCGSSQIEVRERCEKGLQRYHCPACAVQQGQSFATFNDWTGSIFEGSKLPPTDWLLVIGLWELKLNATEIAQAAMINERTAARCLNLLDGGIFETYHLAPDRSLNGPVEADETYQSAGHKGLTRPGEDSGREPRQRGVKLRGRATAEKGRPPILGLAQRRDPEDKTAPPAQVYLEVVDNVRTATIKPIITAKVCAGAQLFTDEYNIYTFATQAGYEHRTVNHGAGEYARHDPDGVCVHCNTIEGIWCGLKNFLDHFRGISQRLLHLRVSRYEFLHNHGHLTWQQTFVAALRFLFSTPGRYLRRMVHQHRRLPLTGCYR
jgi:transposase-like protein